MSRKSLVPIELPADPVNPLEAATKQYVDVRSSQTTTRLSVLAATTGPVNLANPGTTIDSVNISTGVVLVKDQTNAAENGFYYLEAGAPGFFARSGSSVWNTFVNAIAFVEQGTINKDTGWLCTVDKGGTLGTTAMPWKQIVGPGHVTSTELAYDAVYPDHISATGTPDATTYLRGDNTWAVPAGGGGGASLDSYTAVATGGINPLTATVTDLPGVSVTASVGTGEKVLVIGSADLAWVSGTSSTAIVSLYVDGTEWTDPDTSTINQIILTESAVHRVTAHQNWLLTGLSAGSHTLKLRGSSASGGVQVRGTHTKLTVVRLVGSSAVANTYQVGTSNTGTFSAINTDKTVNVTFPSAFSGTPSISLTIVAASSQNIKYPATLISKTASGFSYSVSRATGTAAIDVEWQAILP